MTAGRFLPARARQLAPCASRINSDERHSNKRVIFSEPVRVFPSWRVGRAMQAEHRRTCAGYTDELNKQEPALRLSTVDHI
jgi:hypothetical protein